MAATALHLSMRGGNETTDGGTRGANGVFLCKSYFGRATGLRCALQLLQLSLCLLVEEEEDVTANASVGGGGCSWYICGGAFDYERDDNWTYLAASVEC